MLDVQELRLYAKKFLPQWFIVVYISFKVIKKNGWESYDFEKMRTCSWSCSSFFSKRSNYILSGRTIGSKAEWRFWFPNGKNLKFAHFESL